MKYLQIRGRPDPAVVPLLFEILADSPFVAETRLLDWNVADTDQPTLLFSVTGDRERFTAAIETQPMPVSWDITPIDDDQFYLHLQVDPVPLLEGLLGAVTTEGLIVVKPVVYRDGHVHARFVGESAVLQTVLDAIPEVVDLDVQAIGEYDSGQGASLDDLSDRQREALEIGLELGYFEQPRAATHQDIADAMGCSSSTASEHLQKAQAKLVRRVLSTPSLDG